MDNVEVWWAARDPKESGTREGDYGAKSWPVEIYSAKPVRSASGLIGLSNWRWEPSVPYTMVCRLAPETAERLGLVVDFGECISIRPFPIERVDWRKSEN
jgi:hypothetical protein